MIYKNKAYYHVSPYVGTVCDHFNMQAKIRQVDTGS